jgi:hypothetical protein
MVVTGINNEITKKVQIVYAPAASLVWCPAVQASLQAACGPREAPKNKNKNNNLR